MNNNNNNKKSEILNRTVHTMFRVLSRSIEKGERESGTAVAWQ